jgi:hypothetical protein
MSYRRIAEARVAIGDGVPVADLALIHLLALSAFHRSEPHFPRIVQCGKGGQRAGQSRCACQSLEQPISSLSGPPEGSPTIHVQQNLAAMKLNPPGAGHIAQLSRRGGGRRIGLACGHEVPAEDDEPRVGPELMRRPLPARAARSVGKWQLFGRWLSRSFADL